MNLEQIIQSIAVDTTKEMESILQSAGLGSSSIIREVDLEVDNLGGDIRVTSNFPDYATYVDEGRRPGGQPPINNIIDWCNRKNIDSKYAFPIAKSIAENGTTPTNFLKPLTKIVEEISKTSAIFYTKEIIDTVQKIK